MDFKNGVINIQTAGYNGARTLYQLELGLETPLIQIKGAENKYTSTINQIILICISNFIWLGKIRKSLRVFFRHF